MKMGSYSKSKVSAFFGSHHDNQLRESIRQDVLIERYDDLQKEISHIEDLLNISEDHVDDDLFAINNILFEILESLVPNLFNEDLEEATTSPEEMRAQRAGEIKKREKQVIKISKDKEAINRARSLVKSAQLDVKGSDSPETKKKARATLNRAKQQMDKIGKQK